VLTAHRSILKYVATMTGERRTASAFAAAVEFLEQRQAESRDRVAAAERLQREVVCLRQERERLARRHHKHQRSLAADDVEAWTILAEVADELADLEAEPFAGLSFFGAKPSADALRAAATACRRARKALRTLAARLDELESLLARRGRAVVPDEAAQLIAQWTADAATAESEAIEAARAALGEAVDPAPEERWPSDTGPASLVTRQPVLSNAPPSSDGPAHHLLAAT
jgi:hypothetical protein